MAHEVFATCKYLVPIIKWTAACVLAAAGASGNAREVPGQIDSSLTVSPAGAAVQVINVPTIPGAAGLEPKLALRYSSGSPNVGLGTGWSLVGYPRIALGAKNWESDGVSTGIRLKPDDALFLDGERLIEVRRFGPSNSRVEFRKELDDATRVLAEMDGDGYPNRFTMESKAGLTTTFRAGPRVQRDGVSVPLLFLPERTTDRSGNYIEWLFVERGLDVNLSKVLYTGYAGAAQPAKPPFAEISLEYEAAPRPSISHVLGQSLTRSVRLKAISSTATAPNLATTGNGSLRLDLKYQDVDTGDRFFLSEVSQSGLDGATMPPIRMAHRPPESAWIPFPALSLPSTLTQTGRVSAYQLGRLKMPDGVAGPGMLVSFDAAGGRVSRAFVVAGGGWMEVTSKVPPLSFVDVEGRALGTFMLDVNDDGLSDLIQHDASSGVARAFLQTNAGWEEDARFVPPVALARGGVASRVRQLDIDGDGRLDLVVTQETGSLDILLGKASGWVRATSHALPAGSAAVQFSHPQCPGAATLLVASTSSGQAKVHARAFEEGGWGQPTQVWGSAIDADAPPPELQSVRIAANACPAQMVSFRSRGEWRAVILFPIAAAWKAIDAKLDDAWQVGPSGARLFPRIGDWNGDGLDDLLVSQILPDGTKLAYSLIQAPHAGADEPFRWAKATPDFVPPIAIAGPQGALYGVAIADFNSDGRADLLQLPTQAQPAGIAFLAGAGGWQRAWDFAPATALAQGQPQQGSMRFVDVDGDGAADLLFNYGNGPEEKGAFLNNGKGWTAIPGLAPPRPLSKVGEAQSPGTFIDVDGDGLQDLVFAYVDAQGLPVIETYLNASKTGATSWGSPNPNWRLPAALASAMEGDLGGRFVDLNADGLPDLLWAFQNSNSEVVSAAYLNTGSGWAPAPNIVSPVPFAIQRGPQQSRHTPTNAQIFDVDGDRIPDIIAAHTNSLTPTAVNGVFRGTGAGFATTAWVPVPIPLDGDNPHEPHVHTADVNGDGVLDLLKYSQNEVQVWLGNGAGWAHAIQWDFPQDARSDVLGFAGVRIADVNGDGLADLLYHVPNSGGTMKKGWFLNTGTGWKRGSDNFAPLEPFIAADGSDTGMRIVDVNGDNAADFVKTRKSGSELDRSVFLNPNSRAGALVEVNKTGVRTRFEYASLSEHSARESRTYTRAPHGTYPIIPLTPSRPMVVRVSVDEGRSAQRSTSYRYDGFKYDVRNGMALGFAKIERSEEPSRLRFVSHFEQAYGLIGLKSQDEIFAPGDRTAEVRLAHTIKAWATTAVPILAGPERPNRYLQVTLTSEATKRRDLQDMEVSSDVKQFAYDEWLNVISTTTRNIDGTLHALTNDFGDGGMRRFGRLRTATVSHSRSGAPTQTRTSTFTYEPETLLLASETALASDARFAVTTSHARDYRGNITASTRTAAGFSPRTDGSSSDAYGRVVTRQENALGHAGQREFDAGSIGSALGLPSRVKDANGLTTGISYDGFGRIATKTGSDGVLVKFERFTADEMPADWRADLTHARAQWPASCRGAPLTARADASALAHAAESVSVTPQGGKTRLESVKIFDSAGRQVREIGVRTDGKTARLIFKDVEYDALGRVIGRSRPYFAGSKSYWDRFAYDAMDRKVMEARYDGKCLTYAYVGNRNSRTDPLGRTSTVVMNAVGNAESVIAADGGITTFTYDVMERVLAVASPMKIRTEFRYDTAGNRILTKDPDEGEISSEYDAFGQLRRQKTAGQALWSEFEYDSLGRMTKTWRPDRVASWSYDPAGAIGALASAEGASQNTPVTRSYREEYAYDSQTRVRRKTVTFNGGVGEPKHTAAIATEYDDEGRVALTTYPATVGGRPYQVKRTYHEESGQLITVHDTRGDRPIWALVSGDALGRQVDVALGNGVRSLEQRRAGFSELDRIVVSAGSTVMSDHAYRYDAAGNLSRRSESVTMWAERFEYDASNRLTAVRSTSKTVTAAYDAGGRFIYKSDVGRYEYGCSGPANGVCRVSLSGGGTERIKYDAAGNVTATDRYVAEFNSDNRAIRLAKVTSVGVANALFSEFEYGPGGQRVFTRERGCSDAKCFAYRLKETLHIGFGDRVYTTVGNSRLVTDRFYIDAGSGAFMHIDVVDRSQAQGAERVGPAAVVNFLHRDHLGSISLLTDAKGSVAARFRFDPWGMQSGMKPEIDTSSGSAAAWTRGFSGHDHVPQFALVHMNGRVYDPRLGVFLSVDPLTTDLANPNDLNGYSYAWNNPLTHRDLSGQGIFDDIGRAIGGAARGVGRALGDAARGIGEFVGRNWREIVAVAVVVAVTAATAGTGTGPVIAAMAGGAAGAATATALHGGSVSDVVGSAIMGAILGAFSGAIGGSTLPSHGKAIGYGFVSGTRTAAAGGDFGRGFLVGSITAGIDSRNFVGGNTTIDTALRIAIGATANGTVAELSGDKFANGALSGAFHELWRDAKAQGWKKIEVAARYVGMYQAREATIVGLGMGAVLYGYSTLFKDGTWSFKVNESGAVLISTNRGMDPNTGVTFGNTVIYGPSGDTATDAALVRHELTHVTQWGAYGSQGFWDSYVRQIGSHGYFDAPFESEAQSAGNARAL